MASITIRDVPEDLRKRFKLACVEKDVSMNTQIIELIKQFVDTHEKGRA